jgi:tetratricopeptide (TPR) repeat protein
LELLLIQYHPDILLFNPLQIPQWAMDLRTSPAWRLVYLDSLNAIYLRKGYEDRIPTLDFGKLLFENNVSGALTSQVPSILYAQLPPAWNDYWGDFTRPADYPNDLLNLGILTSYAGNPQASELFFLEAIRQTHGRYPDFYYDLGLLYSYTNRQEEAALCMKRVLRDKPADPVARRIAGI